MNIADFSNLINEIIEFYYKSVSSEYDNLSSFAIVTDSGFETFLVAINKGKYFLDLVKENISDEEYWNVAEWDTQSLSKKYHFSRKQDIIDFLENNSLDQNFLYDLFSNSLTRVRDDDNSDVCMFLHITDHHFDEGLYEIVKQLNGSDIANSYKKYHQSYNEI